MAINQNKIDALKAKIPTDIADYTQKIQDANAQIDVLKAKIDNWKEKRKVANEQLKTIEDLENL